MLHNKPPQNLEAGNNILLTNLESRLSSVATAHLSMLAGIGHGLSHPKAHSTQRSGGQGIGLLRFTRQHSLSPRDLSTWTFQHGSDRRVELLMYQLIVPKRRSSRESCGRCTTLYDLTLEVIQHHFCHILLIKVITQCCQKLTSGSGAKMCNTKAESEYKEGR